MFIQYLYPSYGESVHQCGSECAGRFGLSLRVLVILMRLVQTPTDNTV
jgi:hypothetical protein